MNKKPAALYFLSVLVLFQSIGGLFGGLSLTLKPSGDFLNMPLSYLGNSPFHDYLIPGLILSIILGIYPMVVSYSILKEPEWRWMERLNIYKDQRNAWTHSLYLGIILIFWIDFEIMFIGYSDFLQTVYSLLGMLILIITLLPPVKNYFRKNLIPN